MRVQLRTGNIVEIQAEVPDIDIQSVHIIGSWSNSKFSAHCIIDKNGCCPTIVAGCHGYAGPAVLVDVEKYKE